MTKALYALGFIGAGALAGCATPADRLEHVIEHRQEERDRVTREDREASLNLYRSGRESQLVREKYEALNERWKTESGHDISWEPVKVAGSQLTFGKDEKKGQYVLVPVDTAKAGVEYVGFEFGRKYVRGTNLDSFQDKVGDLEVESPGMVRLYLNRISKERADLVKTGLTVVYIDLDKALPQAEPGPQPGPARAEPPAPLEAGLPLAAPQGPQPPAEPAPPVTGPQPETPQGPQTEGAKPLEPVPPVVGANPEAGQGPAEREPDAIDQRVAAARQAIRDAARETGQAMGEAYRDGLQRVEGVYRDGFASREEEYAGQAQETGRRAAGRVRAHVQGRLGEAQGVIDYSNAQREERNRRFEKLMEQEGLRPLEPAQGGK